MAQEPSVLINEISVDSENEAELRSSPVQFDKQHPGLVDAIDTMNISGNEYLVVLGAMNTAVISSPNTTGIGL